MPVFPASQSRPIHLTASAVIAAASQGGVNAISLKNPLAQPMEIHEIKWQMLSLAATKLAGGAAACKLDLGSIPITNGFVPLFAFGRCSNQLAEEVGPSGQRVGEFSWKLARPLYIPPDGVLLPTFENRSLASSSLTIRVSYSGRTLPRGYRPKRVYVPYASAYASKVMDAASADTDSSKETDLVNQADSPLYLQHFCGRLITYRVSDGFYHDVIAEVAGGMSISVKVTSSSGEQLVRDFTQFRQVFSAPYRTWNAYGAVIPPGNFILAELSKTAESLASANVQAVISMVGWREIGA